MQAVVPVQSTAASELSEPAGLGVVSMDHVVPFHRSARVVTSSGVLIEYPTAVHAVAVGQDTPARKVFIAPDGLGVVCKDQLEAASTVNGISRIRRVAGTTPIIRRIPRPPIWPPALSLRATIHAFLRPGKRLAALLASRRGCASRCNRRAWAVEGGREG